MTRNEPEMTGNEPKMNQSEATESRRQASQEQGAVGAVADCEYIQISSLIKRTGYVIHVSKFKPQGKEGSQGISTSVASISRQF